MHKLKPNSFKLAVLIMAASLFTACTPTPLATNEEDCPLPAQVEECRQKSQLGGSSGYVPFGNTGSNRRINNSSSNSSFSEPRARFGNSTGAKGSSNSVVERVLVVLVVVDLG